MDCRFLICNPYYFQPHFESSPFHSQALFLLPQEDKFYQYYLQHIHDWGMCGHHVIDNSAVCV
jgi:hypothetical protein